MESKYRIRTAPLWLVSLLALPQFAYSQTTVFAEREGFVFFEAESALPDSSAWALREELPNFSGDGYIEWTGPDLFASSGAGQGILTYTFEITNAGNYELRWRTHIAKGDSNTESNDSWVRFPSGVNIAGEQGIYGWSKVFMGHFGAWFWDAKVVDHVGANVRQYFSAGTHTMQVSGRSFGHAIDKMALFKYEELSLSPNDLDIRTGTPQSSIDGNQAIVANNNATDDDTDDVASSENAVNALNIPAGINQPPGECVNESLALAAQADIHEVASQGFNEPTLLVAPESARALLRFDLSNVPPAVSAELQFSVIAGEGEATLSAHLLDATQWQEISADQQGFPENVLLLNETTAVWSTDSRYAMPLPISDLPMDSFSLSLASRGQQPLLLASRENSQHMPLLVVNGESGFCESYRAAAVPDESTEMPPSDSPENSPEPNESGNTSDAVDESEPPIVVQETLQNEQANEAVSSGGSGGGVLFWLNLPMILLFAFARQFGCTKFGRTKNREE